MLGRPTVDYIYSTIYGVDVGVRERVTAYDGQGNPYKFTSYQYGGASTPVNEVLREFNGLGQLTAEYQEHGGLVNAGTSLRVGYTYSEMDGGANHSRPETMKYPFATSPAVPPAKTLSYDYASGPDNNISRLTSLEDGDGTLETLSYLGLGTVVKRGHTLPGPVPPPMSPPTPVDLDLTYITGSSGDAGDQYGGLDRFGRVVIHDWQLTAGTSTTSVDRFDYTYDTNGNRTTKSNWVSDNTYSLDFDETYSYDGLNQLTGMVRDDGFDQSWAYDMLGNWEEFDDDGSGQTRTHDGRNQITAVSGATTPAYDEVGNMITDETNKDYEYDAWNRLIKVRDASNDLIAEYRYDSLNRRVRETTSTTTDLYYSKDWQVIEERDTSLDYDVVQQYVYSPVYIDALVLRDRDTDDDGDLDQRLFVAQDANFNVTALVSDTGTVVERFIYTPFGVATVLDDDFTPDSGNVSDVSWQYRHQGGRWDAESGLVDFRNRPLSPSLGRWMMNDPIGFESNETNHYICLSNNSIISTDPHGLFDPVGWLRRQFFNVTAGVIASKPALFDAMRYGCAAGAGTGLFVGAAMGGGALVVNGGNAIANQQAIRAAALNSGIVGCIGGVVLGVVTASTIITVGSVINDAPVILTPQNGEDIGIVSGIIAGAISGATIGPAVVIAMAPFL